MTLRYIFRSWGDDSVYKVMAEFESQNPCGGVCLKSQCWEGRDRRIPRVRWPASLAYLVSSRLVRSPVSKRWMVFVKITPKLVL